MDSPSKNSLRVIAAPSTDDFWLNDNTGWIFHFIRGTWDSIPPPASPVNPLEMRYFWNNDQLWGVLIDTQYKSYLYRFEDQAWNPFPTPRSVPVNGIIPFSEDDVWIYGDWGLLEHFNGRYWRAITSPITQHIFTMVHLGEDEFLLGTRAQGIFHLTDGQFSKIPTNAFNSEDIFGLVVDKVGKLKQAVTSAGISYQFRDSSLVQIKTNLPYGFYNNMVFQGDSLGLAFNAAQNLFIYRSGHWNSADIPGSQPLVDGRLISTTAGILSGKHGLLLVSKGEFQHFFNDVADQYYIAGGKFDRPIGSGWLDANGDGLLDIVVLNEGAGQLSRLFINQGEHHFLDETAKTPLKRPNLFKRLTIGDINNDGRDDILGFVQHGHQGIIHLIFKNLGVWHHRVQTISLDSLETPSNLNLSDYDNDGDLDLWVAFKYGFAQARGNLLLLENRFSGWFKPKQVIPDSVAQGWNYFTLSADFTGDNLSDIYVANFWQPNKLLVNHGNRFINETDNRFSDLETTNTHYAAAFDMENDGDLDLFTNSRGKGIQSFRNDGSGHFTETTADWGLSPLKTRLYQQSHINFGDFNNDGTIDLIVTNLDSTLSGNRLWFNDQGTHFYPVYNYQNLQFPAAWRSLIGDVDNDGDLDIYSIQDGPNTLWINNINNKKYLNIQLEGIGSNRSGIGAKVWIYTAGQLGDATHLIGYQQLGSTTNLNLTMNSRRLHFGLPDTGSVDLRVQFPDGKIISRRQVPTGQTLNLSERTGILRILSLIPVAIINILTTSTLFNYILMSVFVLSILSITIWFGLKRFRWQLSSLLAMVILNLTAYWVLVFLTSGMEAILKFTLPVLPVIFGTLVPMLWSIRLAAVKQLLQTKKRSNHDKLLKQMLVFSHGEWAMRNLNSLLLLANNLLGQSELSATEVRQLEERITTFTHSTEPAIQELIELAHNTGVVDFDLEDMSVLLRDLTTNLSSILDRLDTGEMPAAIQREPVSNQLSRLKTALRKLRRIVFQNFSCNVRAVVARTTQSLAQSFEDAGITVSQKIENTPHIFGLIPESALVPILDNLMQNALRAMKNSARKMIDIRIYWHSPKLRIDLADTGIGIPATELENIFNAGYSDWQGTGLGLAQARETLEHYGGRIFVKSSELGKGTTLTVELLEGQEPHEVSFTHH